MSHEICQKCAAAGSVSVIVLTPVHEEPIVNRNDEVPLDHVTAGDVQPPDAIVGAVDEKAKAASDRDDVDKDDVVAAPVLNEVVVSRPPLVSDIFSVKLVPLLIDAPNDNVEAVSPACDTGLTTVSQQSVCEPVVASVFHAAPHRTLAGLHCTGASEVAAVRFMTEDPATNAAPIGFPSRPDSTRCVVAPLPNIYHWR